MWTSDRGKKRPVEESAADVGAVTLGEEPAGVYLEEKSVLRLHNNGELELCGSVTVNGVALEKLIEEIAARFAGSMG